MNKSKITWEQTGEILSTLSEFDWTEKVKGFDDTDIYVGTAIICCGELIEIEDIEKIEY